MFGALEDNYVSKDFFFPPELLGNSLLYSLPAGERS